MELTAEERSSSAVMYSFRRSRSLRPHISESSTLERTWTRAVEKYGLTRSPRAQLRRQRNLRQGGGRAAEMDDDEAAESWRLRPERKRLVRLIRRATNCLVWPVSSPSATRNARLDHPVNCRAQERPRHPLRSGEALYSREPSTGMRCWPPARGRCARAGYAAAGGQGLCGEGWRRAEYSPYGSRMISATLPPSRFWLALALGLFAPCRTRGAFCWFLRRLRVRCAIFVALGPAYARRCAVEMLPKPSASTSTGPRPWFLPATAAASAGAHAGSHFHSAKRPTTTNSVAEEQLLGAAGLATHTFFDGIAIGSGFVSRRGWDGCSLSPSSCTNS